MRVQQELERGYGLALQAGARGRGESADAPAAQGAGVGAASEGNEPLNEASRAAFAAWLRAERLATEVAAGSPPPLPRGTRKPSPRRKR
jgi:hypothetical protein